MVNTIEFRDLPDLIGQEVGASNWMVVEQDRIDQFADATGDDQWIHVDPARAATGPYGGTVAHGYLTLSLIPALVRQAVDLVGVSTRINYGLESVRFPAPVRSGASLRAVVQVAGLTPLGGDRARLALRVVVEIAGQERPACVAETLTVLVREDNDSLPTV